MGRIVTLRNGATPLNLRYNNALLSMSYCVKYLALLKYFGALRFLYIYIYIYIYIYVYDYKFTLHFHVKYKQKNKDKQNYTIARYQYTGKYLGVCKKRKLLIKFRFTDEKIKLKRLFVKSLA